MKLVRFSLHMVALVWLLLVFYKGFNDQLGGDPVQALLDFTGIGALNLLIVSLMVSPLAQGLKFGQLIALRRPIGLYSAFYAFSHFLVFIAFELQFEMQLVVAEIIDRPYITVGFVAILVLLTLAFTSVPAIKKRMGSRWFTLHSFSYLAVVLGCLHYLWLVKSTWYEPAIYLAFSLFLVYLRRKKIQKIVK